MTKQIVAMGGGGFLMEESPLLDDFILGLARGADSRVCYVPTAAGDFDRMIVNFYAALGPRCRGTHLPLFRRHHTDIAALLDAQDVIYVGGGNTAYHRLLGEGLGNGIAADVGAGLHFVDGTLREVVTSRANARAYRVERGADGTIVETALPTRYLGAP